MNVIGLQVEELFFIIIRFLDSLSCAIKGTTNFSINRQLCPCTTDGVISLFFNLRPYFLTEEHEKN